MKIGILPVGQVEVRALSELQKELIKAYPDTSCSLIRDVLPVPQNAFDKKRNQHNSSVILSEIRAFAANNEEYHRILVVSDVDIFASGLNYVFGEAYSPGKVALISLWRLKPEFYGQNAGSIVFLSRTLKEAVHEIGHTLGLQHCPKSFCVMHFSNSIFDTDRKQSLFCGQCYLQVALAISKLGQVQS
jgi:archaemetzincin